MSIYHILQNNTGKITPQVKDLYPHLPMNKHILQMHSGSKTQRRYAYGIVLSATWISQLKSRLKTRPGWRDVY